jgi:hypothetical protein
VPARHPRVIVDSGRPPAGSGAAFAFVPGAMKVVLRSPCFRSSMMRCARTRK